MEENLLIFSLSRAWEILDFRRGVDVFDRNLDLLHLQPIRVFQTAQSWSDLGRSDWTRKASDPSTRVCTREISWFDRRWWIYQIIHLQFHYTEWILLCERTYGGKLTGPLRKEVTGVPSSSSHPLECSVTYIFKLTFEFRFRNWSQSSVNYNSFSCYYSLCYTWHVANLVVVSRRFHIQTVIEDLQHMASVS